MFTSPRLMNLLRKSLRILNPGFTDSVRPLSAKLPSCYLLGKLSNHQKFLFFTRSLSGLAQKNESVSDGKWVQMKGLPFEATATDIVNFFKPLDVVPEEITIEKNRWGRPNGYAFIKFKSYGDAFKSLQNHRHYIGRRYIELFLNVKPAIHLTSEYSQGESSTSTSATFDPSKGCKVILRGVPYEATANDIIQFFAPLNIRPSNVEIRRDRFNRPSGICACTFESSEDATTALKNNKEYIGSRWIEVIPESNIKPFSVHEDSTADLATSAAFDSSKGYKVILKGIPYAATASDIVQFFAPLNIRPSNVEIRHDRYNRPSGICACIFESSEDATTALKNHKAYIGSRWIEVIPESNIKPFSVHEDSTADLGKVPAE